MKDTMRIDGRLKDSKKALMQIYDVSYATVANWRKGGLEGILIGNRLYFDREGAKNFILAWHERFKRR
jgi:hypothetical protein